jgi:hypothetical protein
MSADPAATAPVDPPPVSIEGRWLPVLAVVAVIALVAGGGRIAGAARDGAGAAPRVVGNAVRIQPLPGWTAATPPGSQQEVLLTRGPVTLDVVALPGSTGDPETLARSYVDRILRSRFDQLQIGQSSTGTLASGVPAIRFGYFGIADGVAIEGVTTVADGPSAGAVFDASAPKGDLAWAASDVDTMIDGAEVG